MLVFLYAIHIKFIRTKVPNPPQNSKSAFAQNFKNPAKQTSTFQVSYKYPIQKISHPSPIKSKLYIFRLILLPKIKIICLPEILRFIASRSSSLPCAPLESFQNPKISSSHFLSYLFTGILPALCNY